MNVTILGTNGFLSRAVALYCNEKGYPVNMYGLDEPVGHQYVSFQQVNFMTDDVEFKDICKSDIIVYVIGAGNGGYMPGGMQQKEIRTCGNRFLIHQR